MIKVLTQPLTQSEIDKLKDEHDHIEGVVTVSLPEMIDVDFDEFLELLSDRLIDGESSCILTDIEYAVAGADADNDKIFIRVTGTIDTI